MHECAVTMKLAVLCLLLVLSVTGPARATSGRDNFEVKQRHVIELLERIHDHSSYDYLEQTAKQYNPEEHHDAYKDYHIVERYLHHAKKHLHKHHYFNLFDPVHRREAVQLFEVFMTCNTYDDFFKTAAWARHHSNEELFAYSYIVAVLNRPDMHSIQVPPMYEINPHFFTTSEVINEAYSAKMRQVDEVIEQHFTGTPYNPEQWVAYFGEDVGLNNHHFHWHADFPFWWKEEYPIKKDRKGEFFFYAHHQMTNRFNSERLSNHLPVVEPLDWHKTIKQGFRPQTTYKHEGEFPFRPDNQHFHDLPFVSINELQIYEQRIKDAIAQGFVYSDHGHKIDINNTDGINILGQVIEASAYSPNPSYYGSLHNLGHVMLSRTSDPEGKYGLPPGVMEHFQTATRDPAFFRLHTYIDDIFKEYKNWLIPYTHDELNFHGVAVTDLYVTSGSKKNDLTTFFDTFTFDLTNGLDGKDGHLDIKSKVQRLNHNEFDFNINVHSNDPHTAVVRIFLAPTYSYYGEMMDNEEQRWLFIELDKFTAKLSPGDNHIVRSSKDSSVTIPERLGFKEMKKKLHEGTLKYEEHKRHCGHPHNLFIPKGNDNGMQYTLVVFLSDFEHDKAFDHDPSHNFGDSLSYCGTLHEEYPDKQPLGYPFDRRIEDYDDFLSNQNMKYTHIKITHTS